MTECHTITAGLDAYLDGELTGAERDAVDAHLAGCPRCRAEAAAIGAILNSARALPNSVPPARDLWPGIESRLATRAAVPVRSPVAGGAPAVRSWARLAAAFGLILFGAGVGTLWQRRLAPSGFAAEQARYAAASAELARKLTADPAVIAPATRAVVERNLAIIDRAIREAETALAADPGNTPLEQMLVARYRQRLALLRHATGAGRMES